MNDFLHTSEYNLVFNKIQSAKNLRILILLNMQWPKYSLTTTVIFSTVNLHGYGVICHARKIRK